MLEQTDGLWRPGQRLAAPDEPPAWFASAEDLRVTGAPAAPLSFVVGDDEPSDANLPLPAFAAVSNGVLSLGIQREDLADFLREHAEGVLVCADAARMFIQLQQWFLDRQEADAIRVLWELVKQCRLVDLRSLDQCFRRIDAGQVWHQPASLTRLCEWYLKEEAPSQPELPDQHGTQLFGGRDSALAQQAVAILRIHAQLVQRFSRVLPNQAPTKRTSHTVATGPDVPYGLATPLDVPSPRQQGKTLYDREWNSIFHFSPPERYGLAGSGLDVLGAVALQEATQRGMAIDRGQLHDLAQRSKARLLTASRRLRTDPSAAKHLSWEGDLCTLDQHGDPRGIRDAIKSVWQLKRNRLGDRGDAAELLPAKPPPDPESLIAATRPAALGDECLQALGDLWRAARMAKFAAAVSGDSVHPQFVATPYVMSHHPDLAFLRELQVPLFVPREGHIFLVITLDDLPIRAWLALSAQLFQKCQRSLFAGTWGECRHEKRDPIPSVVEELLGKESAGQQHHGLIRCWLETLPWGLSPPVHRDVVRSLCGADLSSADYDDLFDKTMGLLAGSELGFLVMESGAPAVNIDDIAARRRMGLSSVVAPAAQGVHEISRAAVMKMIEEEAQRRELPWSHPKRGEQSGTSKEGNGSSESRASPMRLEETVGGRIVAGRSIYSVRRLAWRQLTDDVVKTLAFAMCLHGHNLVAVVEGELVFDVPLSVKRGKWTKRGVRYLCREALRELVVHDELPHRRYRWARRWPIPSASSQP